MEPSADELEASSA